MKILYIIYNSQFNKQTNVSFIMLITPLRFKSTVKDNTGQTERKEGNRTHTKTQRYGQGSISAGH